MGERIRRPAVKPFYYSQPRTDIIHFVPKDAKRILDVGCGVGITGGYLREKFGMEVYGIELEEDIAEAAKDVLNDVVVGDVEKYNLPYPEGFFDCIIFGDVLEHLFDPWKVLIRLWPLLSKEGTVVASIPNISYHETLGNLILGRWDYQDLGILDISHIRFFTRRTIQEMFRNTGYRIEQIQGISIPENREKRKIWFDEGLGDKLSDVVRLFSFDSIAPQFQADVLDDFFMFQYIVTAKKLTPSLMDDECFRRNLLLFHTQDVRLLRRLEGKFVLEGGIWVKNTRSGDLTLEIQDELGRRMIHSAYDPKREAERFVSRVDFGGGDVIFVLGVGLGYHLDKIMERRRPGQVVVVVERDTRIFKLALKVVDFSDYLLEKDIVFFINEDLKILVAKAEKILQERRVVVFDYFPITQRDKYFLELKRFLEAKKH